MAIYENINKIHELQSSWFEHRNNADTLTMIAYSFIFACFTGLMAQVSIAIPWSPVLVTFQTFAALLAGSFLGSKYGSFSMILYALLGIIGMPWFTQMRFGLDMILGVSGGYIIGFVIAAYFSGYVFDHYANSRKTIQTVIVMLIANFICIYIPGLIGLYHAMATTGTILSISELLLMGLAPFIAGDLLKIALASAISTSVLPKEE